MRKINIPTFLLQSRGKGPGDLRDIRCIASLNSCYNIARF